MVGISPDCDGFPHPLGVSFKNAWNWMREGIADCVDAAADAGLKLAFEYKPKETRNFSLVANADTVLRLIDQVGSSNLGVLLDTGHAMYAKEDLPTTVEKLDKTLFHVHLCDNYGDWDDDLAPGVVHDTVLRGFEKDRLQRVRGLGYLSVAGSFWRVQEKQGIHRPDVFQTRETGLIGHCLPDLCTGIRALIALIRSGPDSRCGVWSKQKIGNHAVRMAVFCARLADLWLVQAYSRNFFPAAFPEALG
jgi:hypothetical protein